MNSRIKAACPGAIGIEDQVFVAILKTADTLAGQAEQLMKASGLTGAQYNVLRILRGAGPEGLPCNGISERMISRDPDMTRMLDRMESRQWITRERQTEDRRVVKARITDEGLKLLKKMDAPVRELHKQQFAHMSAARQKTLLELVNELMTREPE
ncbi:MAG TPA: MarR family transcriptional regulator [Terriglobales bacterium]|nr:MarR family transcriptional regulator [Terriglobales bacterium]